MYEKFVWWLTCLSMEEVFIFTYASIVVVGFAIGLPLGLYLERNRNYCNISNN